MGELDPFVEIKSIVFPRNQISQEYLKICKQNGIISYRGYEDHEIYKPRSRKKSKKILHRVLRITDAYYNITGNHTYKLNGLVENDIVNIPSSYFLRPYNNTLKILEPLKIRRVKMAMDFAAKNNELFHLWFHPHNFGQNMDKNIKNLELIFKEFVKFRDKYSFECKTMSELANELKLN